MSWVGFDLDGTLAEYHGWDSGVIGEPIPRMVNQAKAYLNLGYEVRIVTARVAGLSGRELDDAILPIALWCIKHIGQVLTVTSEKDFGMTQLYDDRAVAVETNTGRILGGFYGKLLCGPDQDLLSLARDADRIADLLIGAENFLESRVRSLAKGLRLVAINA